MPFPIRAAAVLVLIATASAVAQRHVQNTNETDAAMKELHSNVIQSVYPDIAVFNLGWKEYEERRAHDLVEMNGLLYDLTGPERERVSSIVEKLNVAASQTKGEADNEELARMIDQRADLFHQIAGNENPQKLSQDVIEKLLASGELLESRAIVDKLESTRQEQIVQLQPIIESMIGPERTAAAYSQWEYRLQQSGDRVAVKSLLSAMPTPAAAAAHSKPQTPPSAGLLEPQTPRGRAQRMRDMKRDEARRAPPARTPPRATKPAEKPTPPGKATPPADAEKPPTKQPTPQRQTPPRRTQSEKPVPLDQWEQYVHDFLKEHACTPEQTNSALAILSELKSRASAHETAAVKQREAAESIKDRRQRQARLDEINKPIDRLFDQLKRRLDGLLTSQQRAIQREKTAKTPTKSRSGGASR